MEIATSTLQVLHFQALDVSSCVELKYVEKILPLAALEAVPNSPDYFAGLMNYTGAIVPVIDLALFLTLTRHKHYSIEIPVLLCRDGEKRIAMIVDNILGLAMVDKNEIKMHDDFNHINSVFIGVVKHDAKLSLLIDIKKMLQLNMLSERIDGGIKRLIYE